MKRTKTKFALKFQPMKTYRTKDFGANFKQTTQQNMEKQTKKRRIKIMVHGDDVKWVLVQYEDNVLSDPIKLNDCEHEETGEDGVEAKLEEGDWCLAPYTDGCSYKGKILMISDDKSKVLKDRATLQASGKGKKVTKNIESSSSPCSHVQKQVKKRKTVEEPQKPKEKKKDGSNEKRIKPINSKIDMSSMSMVAGFKSVMGDIDDNNNEQSDDSTCFMKTSQLLTTSVGMLNGDSTNYNNIELHDDPTTSKYTELRSMQEEIEQLEKENRDLSYKLKLAQQEIIMLKKGRNADTVEQLSWHVMEMGNILGNQSLEFDDHKTTLCLVDSAIDKDIEKNAINSERPINKSRPEERLKFPSVSESSHSSSSYLQVDRPRSNSDRLLTDQDVERNAIILERPNKNRPKQRLNFSSDSESSPSNSNVQVDRPRSHSDRLLIAQDIGNSETPNKNRPEERLKFLSDSDSSPSSSYAQVDRPRTNSDRLLTDQDDSCQSKAQKTKKTLIEDPKDPLRFKDVMVDTYGLYQAERKASGSSNPSVCLLNHTIDLVFTTSELAASTGLGIRNFNKENDPKKLEKNPLDATKVAAVKEYIRAMAKRNK